MKEKAFKYIFLATALVSIAAVLTICIFLFGEGIPAIKEIGFKEFLFGTEWNPTNVPAEYGIFPMILGSICVTLGAIIIGVPIGLLTAVFMAEYCPKKPYKVLKPATELLAGIPSIVYGFFGLVVMVPFVKALGKALSPAAEAVGLSTSGNGNAMLTACIILGIMILPTIIGTAEAALRSVPREYYEGSLALGATHERTIFKVMMPAAKSGVVAGIVLGIGRAIGETMAVIMIAGNQARMPAGLFKGIRTMTANIVIEMGYAEGTHREALIATGAVLFVFILIINFIFAFIQRRKDK